MNHSKTAILLSSVGRRAQLIDCFREAFQDLGIEGGVIGADVSPKLAPAGHLTDRCYSVPPCTDPAFIDEILRIVAQEKVRLIVPTIDTELPVYAAHRARFVERGVTIAVSDPAVISIAGDKALTHAWLVKNRFPTLKQASAEEVLRSPSEWPFPVIAKPIRGSASTGVVTVSSFEMLSELTRVQRGLIVQEVARGLEYTINVFVQDGKCLCAVPHRRIETRGGEVSKAVTVKDPYLMDLATRIAECLPGARGALNVQCFSEQPGQASVIEINARFGGGFPLAHRAGAKFARWLLREVLGLPKETEYGWVDDLLMLRYDSAVFLSVQDRSNV